MPDAHKRKKVPRYDEFGNYLGDFTEEQTCAEPSKEQVDAEPTTKVVHLKESQVVPNSAVIPTQHSTGLDQRVLHTSAIDRIPAAIRRMPPQGTMKCGISDTFLDQTVTCGFCAKSALELMLHRADRHLIYPPGGEEELRRRDPMRAAQERERNAAIRRGIQRGADGPIDSKIQGLNICLDTPELIKEWIQQRKKRFPTAEVVAEKRRKHMRPTMTSTTADSKRTEADHKATSAHSALSYEERHARVDKNYAKDTKTTDQNGHDSESESDSSSDQTTSSNSDMDSERDAISSKVPVASGAVRAPEHAQSPRVCRYYLQGTCTFGDKCRQSHQGTGSVARRSMPRPAMRNPFEPPQLLRSMLDREIEQHTDALAQLIRFVLDNDMLLNVERRVGDAASQAERLQRVVPLSQDMKPEKSNRAEPQLRALADLRWPEEPDPFVYMDPLRRADPKPLRHTELEQLATDERLRMILTPSTPLHPTGVVNQELRTALQSWDALPSDRHRSAALQLVLGVGAQSPLYAHDAYTPAMQRARAIHTSKRFIGEAELLRHGLRIGPEEVRAIQHIAERVSTITGNGTVTWETE
ncbi:hypothetical protein MPSI1_002186 [Malassezia psittaci]|uniref:C3H1-type domain-containing protein n=1 Tax=Malassezia psittaci TaxID=1821823 RepID=A0AAF0FAT4_9BASI|nr:hypothetical protein MPSI1_002186 [Malassezia psittaci]